MWFVCLLAAAHDRELEEEKRRLNVSITAREEDLLVSDRQTQALSTRLKGEARASGEAAARAEAVAGELRKAFKEAAAEGALGAAAAAGDDIGGGGGEPSGGEREGGGGCGGGRGGGADRCVLGLNTRYCNSKRNLLVRFKGSDSRDGGGGRGGSDGVLLEEQTLPFIVFVRRRG